MIWNVCNCASLDRAMAAEMKLLYGKCVECLMSQTRTCGLFQCGWMKDEIPQIHAFPQWNRLTITVIHAKTVAPVKWANCTDWTQRKRMSQTVIILMKEKAEIFHCRFRLCAYFDVWCVTVVCVLIRLFGHHWIYTTFHNISSTLTNTKYTQ